MEQDDRAALDALERQVKPVSGGEEEIDQSLLYQEQSLDMSNVDDLWEEGRYPMQCVNLRLKCSKAKGFRYLELDWLAIAGKRKDQTFQDRVMLEGESPKALARLNNLGKAVDMYDEANKLFVGRYIDIVNRCAWVDIVNRQEEYKGEKRMKSSVAFRGYSHFSKFVLAEDTDLFAEDGDPVEALATEPAAPIYEAPEVLVEEVLYEEPVAEVQEAPFVEETVPVAPQPPVSVPRAAPRPVAAAPKAGPRPPF